MTRTSTQSILDNDTNDSFLQAFDSTGSSRGKVYLLQVMTESSRLDDVLYSLAHPTAPDALSQGAEHQDVVAVVREIARRYTSHRQNFINSIADEYEAEYCQ